jgi:hypothetical protein
LQPVAAELDAERSKAGDVAAGMREASVETGRYRISAEPPDDWDRRRGILRDLRDVASAINDNDIPKVAPWRRPDPTLSPGSKYRGPSSSQRSAP